MEIYTDAVQETDGLESFPEQQKEYDILKEDSAVEALKEESAGQEAETEESDKPGANGKFGVAKFSKAEKFGDKCYQEITLGSLQLTQGYLLMVT